MSYRRVEFGEEREYEIPELGGRRLLSATTITGVLHKPALIQWSANQAVEYVQRELLDDLIAGKIDADDIRNMDIASFMKSAKNYHAKKSGKALAIGKRVHSFVKKYMEAAASKEQVVLKFEDDIEKPVMAFVEWFKMSQVVPEFLEHRVWSIRGGGYAGTLDFFGKVRGKPTLLDYKAATDVYEEHKLQVAAYYGAFIERNPGIPKLVSQTSVLILNKETGMPEETILPVPKTKEYLKAFLLLSQYANCVHQMKEKAAEKSGKKKREVAVG